MGIYSKKTIRDLDKTFFTNMFIAMLLKIPNQLDSTLMPNSRTIVHLYNTILD